MKKITVLLPDLNVIGAQRVALDYAMELVKHGKSVRLAVARYGDEPISIDGLEVINFGASGVFNIPKLRVLFDFIFFVIWIARDESNVILSVTPLYNRYLCIAKLFHLFKGKAVIEDHSYPPVAYFDEFKKPLVRFFFNKTEWLYSYADRFRVLSIEAFDYYRKGSISPVVFPNLMDFKRIDCFDRSIPVSNVYDLVYIGRFETQKNLFFLIDAFEILLKRENVSLLIIGYGSLKNSLIDYVKLKSLCGHVFFRDSDNKNLSYLSAARVFPLTSIWEGFPLVIIESMRLKVPVVSVDCKTGPRALIGDNERGWLVQENDITLFARALENALNNPDEAFRRASLAYDFVDNKLCIDKNFSIYLKKFID